MSGQPGGKLRVEVSTDLDDAGELPRAETIETWITAALLAASLSFERDTEVSVSLVATEEMRRLNRDFRGKDRPTNVLSFPGGDAHALPPGAPALLGDVVLCPEIVAAEATEQHKPLEAHWAHLVVHGALHLAGYDHIDDHDAEAMEDLETAVLRGFGIPDPYQAREA